MQERNAGGAPNQKTKQCHKYFFNTVKLRAKELTLEHGGAKLVFCIGRYLASLRP